MYEEREVMVQRTFCICDRCGRAMDSIALDGEWEERVSVSFRCGYFSEFGDGNLVEGDFCQHCVKEILGSWLRVTEDNPIEAKAKPAYEATRAYQEYQLREKTHGRQSLRPLFDLEPADAADDTEPESTACQS